MQKIKSQVRTVVLSILAFLLVTTLLVLPVGASMVDVSPNVRSISRTSGASEIRGIDVSKWQGRVHWDMVASDNVDFAFIRASYGTQRDPYFFTNAKEAHENGLKVGAYHFAKFTNTSEMKKEAQVFLKQLERVEITYPVVLDIEKTNGLSRRQLSSLCKQFMDIISSNGYTVMIYSNQNFFHDHLDVSYFSGYDYWIAHYNRKPNLPHAIWQHSCTGRVRGVNGPVDINVAYRDMSVRATGTSAQQIVINKVDSDAIKTRLNQTYSSGISMEKFDASYIKRQITIALQKELNKIYKNPVEVTGILSLQDLQRIVTLDYSEGYSEVISLLQSQLFFLGFYEGQPTGTLDNETKTALQEYQDYYHLPVSGAFDRTTLKRMFGVATDI